MSEYFSDITGKDVWPIIQAEDLTADEFKLAVKAVTQGGGDGILVYTHRKMKKELWPVLANFYPQQNLLKIGESYIYNLLLGISFALLKRVCVILDGRPILACKFDTYCNCQVVLNGIFVL